MSLGQAILAITEEDASTSFDVRVRRQAWQVY